MEHSFIYLYFLFALYFKLFKTSHTDCTAIASDNINKMTKSLQYQRKNINSSIFVYVCVPIPGACVLKCEFESSDRLFIMFDV